MNFLLVKNPLTVWVWTCLLIGAVNALESRADEETVRQEPAAGVAQQVEPTAGEVSGGPAARVTVLVRDVRLNREAFGRLLAAPAGEQLDQQLRELEEAGEISEVRQVQLLANDGQKAQVVFGRRVAVITGMVTRGGQQFPIQQRQYENVGTTLQVTSRVYRQRVVVSLNYESSDLNEATSENEPPGVSTQMVQTELDLAVGESTLVVAGTVDVSRALIVTVNVVESGKSGDEPASAVPATVGD